MERISHLNGGMDVEIPIRKRAIVVNAKRS